MSDHDDQVDAWLAQLALDDEAGPAPRIASGEADALIQAAIAEAELYPAMGTEEAAVVPLASRRPRSYLERVAVAAVILLGLSGTASAAVYIYREVLEIKSAEQGPVSVTPAAVEAAPEPRTVPEPAPPVPPPVANVEQPASVPAVVEVPDKIEPQKPARRAKARATDATPGDLLRKANGHRAAGRWRAADALYSRVIREAPRSQTAHVARVASGDLRLGRLADPRGALRRYRAALGAAPNGWLSEDASYGIVESLRRLKRSSAEQDALRSFLKRYPDSARATQASRRLRELETPPPAQAE